MPKHKAVKSVRAWMVFHNNDNTPVRCDDEHDFVVSPDGNYLKYHWREKCFKVVEIEIKVLTRKSRKRLDKK